MVSENLKTAKKIYKRVLPALRSKVKELKSQKITFVEEKDIWNFLKNTKWYEENNLLLLDIVNDILFLDEKEIIDYMNKTYKINSERKEFQDEKVKEDSIL